MSEKENMYKLCPGVALKLHLNEICKRLCLRILELDEKALLRLAKHLLASEENP